MTDWLSRTFVKDYMRTDDHGVRMAYGRLASIVGIVCNILLCAVKALIGLAAGSAAIVADAVNNLSDAVGNVVSLVGFKLASRPADAGHPYGHGRYEYLAGLAVSVLICVIGFELVRAGYERIVAPQDVEFSVWLVVVLLLAAAVKLWMCRFSGVLGRRINSEALKANAVDSRNDVVTTLAVLACAVVTHFTGVDLDGWASLVIGAMVLISGLKLAREIINPLIGQAPDPEFVERVNEKLLGYPGVLGTHDLTVHEYGPSQRYAMVDIELAGDESLLSAHRIVDRIERDFLACEGIALRVHAEPLLADGPELDELREYVEREAAAIEGGAQARNVRCVPGYERVSVVFDLLRPAASSRSGEQLADAMEAAICERYPGAECSITVIDGE